MNLTKDCPVCGKAIQVEINAEVWRDACDLIPRLKTYFASYVACNSCWDTQTTLGHATAPVKKVCERLAQAAASGATVVSTADRLAVVLASQGYAQVVCRLAGVSPYVWSEDFAEMLIDRPELWPKILKFYRENVGTDKFRSQPSNETAH